MVAYKLLFTLLVLTFSFPEIISPLSLSLAIIMDRSTTCSCSSCDNLLNFICHIVRINALSRTTGHLKKKHDFIAEFIFTRIKCIILGLEQSVYPNQAIVQDA